MPTRIPPFKTGHAPVRRAFEPRSHASHGAHGGGGSVGSI